MGGNSFATEADGVSTFFGKEVIHFFICRNRFIVGKKIWFSVFKNFCKDNGELHAPRVLVTKVYEIEKNGIVIRI